MGQWTVTIDRDVCVGSGTCRAVAAASFSLDDEDRSVPTAATFGPDPDLLEAAQLCPTAAITIVDAETGRPVTAAT